MSEQTAQQGKHGWGAIPRALRTRSQWVVTDNKEPLHPSSDWNEPEHQLSFERAREFSDRHRGGLGYVLSANDPYIVIDLDDVWPTNQAEVSDEAREIVQRLDTYTETSRSGTGLHLICNGTQLPDRSIKGELDDRGSIEMYDGGQYVVLTGQQFGSYDTIRDGHRAGDDAEDILSELQREYLPAQPDLGEKRCSARQFELESISGDSLSLQTEDIRRTLEEYKTAGHQKARRALTRWNSTAGSSRGGFPSASEADMALVADLAFWCGNDAQLIDECFRASNRMREKWTQVHYADGRTYGEGTIQTAIRTNYDTFSGRYVQHR